MPPASTARIVYPAIFLAAGLYVFIVNFSLLSPIILALCLILLITLALNPVVARLRRFLVRREFATGLMAFIFLIFLAVAAWAFYTPARRFAADFEKQFPKYMQKLEAPLEKLEGKSTTGKEEGGPGGAERVHADMSALISHLGKWAQDLVSNTAALAAVALTVFVGVVYTLMNPRPVFKMFFALVPEDHQETAMRVGKRMAIFVPRWALALVLGMATVGAAVFFAVWPILGFQNAILMGVVAFVFESIPYVGAILAGTPALLLAMQQGGSAPLWIVVAYVAVQLAEHNIINPLIVARSVQQHPLAVIVSVLFCLASFGILGVLLAVPLVATLEIFYDEVYRPRFLPNVTAQEMEDKAREMLGTGALKSHFRSKDDPSDPMSARRLHHDAGWREQTP